MPRLLTYFAYGSNMHPARLRERVPSCRTLGPGELCGYALRFHKRGRDGSAKCNVVYTSRDTDRVVGVVYRIEAAEKTWLDEAEGLGRGYDERMLAVAAGEARHTAFLYVAQPAYIDDSLRPFDWYKALVVGGARAHGLPEPYLKALEAVEAIPDWDPARAALHLHLLDALRAEPVTDWHDPCASGDRSRGR